METCLNDAVNFNETFTELYQTLVLTRGQQLEFQQETVHSKQAISGRVHFQRHCLQRWG